MEEEFYRETRETIALSLVFLFGFLCAFRAVRFCTLRYLMTEGWLSEQDVVHLASLRSPIPYILAYALAATWASLSVVPATLLLQLLKPNTSTTSTTTTNEWWVWAWRQLVVESCLMRQWWDWVFVMGNIGTFGLVPFAYFYYEAHDDAADSVFAFSFYSPAKIKEALQTQLLLLLILYALAYILHALLALPTTVSFFVMLNGAASLLSALLCLRSLGRGFRTILRLTYHNHHSHNMDNDSHVNDDIEDTVESNVNQLDAERHRVRAEMANLEFKLDRLSNTRLNLETTEITSLFSATDSHGSSRTYKSIDQTMSEMMAQYEHLSARLNRLDSLLNRPRRTWMTRLGAFIALILLKLLSLTPFRHLPLLSDSIRRPTSTSTTTPGSTSFPHLTYSLNTTHRTTINLFILLLRTLAFIGLLVIWTGLLVMLCANALGALFGYLNWIYDAGHDETAGVPTNSMGTADDGTYVSGVVAWLGQFLWNPFSLTSSPPPSSHSTSYPSSASSMLISTLTSSAHHDGSQGTTPTTESNESHGFGGWIPPGMTALLKMGEVMRWLWKWVELVLVLFYEVCCVVGVVEGFRRRRRRASGRGRGKEKQRRTEMRQGRRGKHVVSDAADERESGDGARTLAGLGGLGSFLGQIRRRRWPPSGSGTAMGSGHGDGVEGGTSLSRSRTAPAAKSMDDLALMNARPRPPTHGTLSSPSTSSAGVLSRSGSGLFTAHTTATSAPPQPSSSSLCHHTHRNDKTADHIINKNNNGGGDDGGDDDLPPVAEYIENLPGLLYMAHIVMTVSGSLPILLRLLSISPPLMTSPFSFFGDGSSDTGRLFSFTSRLFESTEFGKSSSSTCTIGGRGELSVQVHPRDGFHDVLFRWMAVRSGFELGGFWYKVILLGVLSWEFVGGI